MRESERGRERPAQVKHEGPHDRGIKHDGPQPRKVKSGPELQSCEISQDARSRTKPRTISHERPAKSHWKSRKNKAEAARGEEPQRLLFVRTVFTASTMYCTLPLFSPAREIRP